MTQRIEPRSSSRQRRTATAVPPALSCLFWNAGRKDLTDLVAQAVVDTQAHLVILIEHDSRTLDALRAVDPSFYEPDGNLPRFQVCSRVERFALHEVYDDLSGRLTIRTLQLGQTELLLAAAHLPSKVNWNRADQAAEVAELSDQIRREEDRHGHRRTVLVGDLNMNPFEDGVVQAKGLHATMAADIAAAGTRKVQGRDYPFFYNPMWAFFGDRTPGPPGTFYHRHTGHVSYDWNMFDQVLLRPEVLDLFHVDVEIATMVGGTDLRNRLGRPDTEAGSDHFPIHFCLTPTS